MLLFSYKYIDSGDFFGEENDKRSDRSWKILIYENGKVFYKYDEKKHTTHIRSSDVAKIRDCCEKCLKTITKYPLGDHWGADCDIVDISLLEQWKYCFEDGGSLWRLDVEQGKGEAALRALCRIIERVLMKYRVWVSFDYWIFYTLFGKIITIAEFKILAWVWKIQRKFREFGKEKRK